jgi:hypothetical protein
MREKPQKGQNSGQPAKHKPNTNYTHLKQQSQEHTRIKTTACAGFELRSPLFAPNYSNVLDQLSYPARDTLLVQLYS